MPPQFEKNIPNSYSLKPPTNHWKNRRVLMMIIGGILLLVSLGLWVLVNTPRYPLDKASIGPDKFSNWKTYRSEEYGFEFKYPKDWLVEYKDEYGFRFFSISKKALDPGWTKTGFGAVLGITLFSEEQYLDILNECNVPKDTDVIDCYRLKNRFLGQNKDNYFVYDLTRDITDFPPSFLNDGTFDIGLALIKTFQFIK